MFNKPPSLAALAAQYEKIAHEIERVNKAAARNPFVQAALAELTERAEFKILKTAVLINVSTACLHLLDAAAASPFMKMAQSSVISKTARAQSSKPSA